MITNLPSTYSKATTGYDVNANQLSRIIGQKSSELAPALQTAETSLAGAENNLNTRMGYEQADQAKALLPYQTEKDLLSERQARETTLYSQDNENELNALIQKMNMGISLSEGEKNRAQQLAIAEKGYQQALEIAKMNNQGTTSPQYMSVGEGTSVIDPATGRVIYSKGKTYAPGTGTSADISAFLPQKTGSTSGTANPIINWNKYGL